MPFADPQKNKRSKKISKLRWNIKHGKTTSSTHSRLLRPEEIEERKKQLDALLADPIRTSVDPGSTQPTSTEPAIPPGPGTHDLYVMENSRIPGELKIGCSKDVPRRKRDFEAQQNFRINVIAVFPGKGYLEREVHLQLSHLRVAECAGTEWFKCSLGEALAAIDQVLRRA